MDAIQIHYDLRSKKSISMHHSTIVLADEPYDEPPKLLSEKSLEHNVNFINVLIGSLNTE